MQAQSRILVVTVVFSLVALFGLSMMAQRYVKLLERRQGAPVPVVGVVVPDERAAPPPARRVEAFVAVRAVLRAAIDADTTGDGPGLARLLEVRRERLRELGQGEADYLVLLRDYRRWRGGQGGVAPELALEFERRRAELEALRLGPYENAEL